MLSLVHAAALRYQKKNCCLAMIQILLIVHPVKRILALETPYDFYSAIRNSAGIVQNLLQGWIATFRSYHAGR